MDYDLQAITSEDLKELELHVLQEKRRREQEALASRIMKDITKKDIDIYFEAVDTFCHNEDYTPAMYSLALQRSGKAQRRV